MHDYLLGKRDTMGIFSKLFGRKKKQEKQPVNEKTTRPAEPSDEVSLEDVNESLEEVNTIQKDEPKKEAPSKPGPEKTEEKKTTEKAPTEEPAKAEKQPDDEKPVYDIKKHPEGWQVIKQGSDKAYRVFDYQKQAIDFAKSEDLEYRVFKSDGTLRK